MTSDAGKVEISHAEVASLADKLQAFSATLSDQEHLALRWVLARATAGGSAEVSGYIDLSGLVGAPFSTQVFNAAGLGVDKGSLSFDAAPLKATRPFGVPGTE